MILGVLNSRLIVFGYIQDMFEKVNKAYEFLCTKSAKIMDGPDPENIILILKTQSILFNRHKEGKACVMIFPLANSTMFLVSAAYSFGGG